MAIQIGLGGWGDHDALYEAGIAAQDKLAYYSRYFPIVEVDSAFYAIQSEERMRRWSAQTPDSFQFLVKAYQGLTGQRRGDDPYFANKQEMFAALRQSVAPLIEEGKLMAVLFQYPPWFDCTQRNVRELREARESMQGIPCALEFRHQSWFTADYHDKTLAFMEREGWIHTVCDEPQVGTGSVPTVLRATDPELTIVRMHGRHAAGWSQASAPNWREVRYLYRYSEQELDEWMANLHTLQQQSRQISVIFNNNSGGDAADNARQLMRMLGQTVYEPPEQLDLF